MELLHNFLDLGRRFHFLVLKRVSSSVCICPVEGWGPAKAKGSHKARWQAAVRMNTLRLALSLGVLIYLSHTPQEHTP